MDGMSSLCTDDSSINGSENVGPSPGRKFNPRSIASGMVKISENKIAASK